MGRRVPDALADRLVQRGRRIDGDSRIVPGYWCEHLPARLVEGLDRFEWTDATAKVDRAVSCPAAVRAAHRRIYR